MAPWDVKHDRDEKGNSIRQELVPSDNVKLRAKLDQANGEIERLRAELAVAIKLYAKARGISIDDATDNVRDAVDIHLSST